MRDDRASSLIRLSSGEKVSVRKLGWHVAERYVRCRSVVKVRARTVRTKGGKRLRLEVPEVVTVWSPQVRPELVERGVAWMAGAWRLGHEPELPADLRRVA